MQFKEIVISSEQALRSNIMRTSLTMLGIVIGISSVILISSIGQGAVAFITKELSVFGTNYFQVVTGKDSFSSFAGTANPITLEDADAIKEANLSNVEYVASFAFSSRHISGNDEKTMSMVYGLTAEAQTMLKPDILYGEFISEADDASSAKVAVLGLDVAEKFFGENSNPVGESIRIDDIRFRVVGVTKASGGLFGSFFNNAVSIPLNTMITYITGSDDLTEIDVSVKDENLVDQTIADVQTILADHRGFEAGEELDFHIDSFKDSLAIIQTVTSLLTLMVAGISGISLVVGGVGVMNIMLVTVTERTKEIGLLKAIGARENDILTQFLIESVALTLVGGIIGILLGISGAFIISRAVNIPFVVSPISIILAVGASSLVGIIFGLYPARRAAKLNPIDALRYE